MRSCLMLLVLMVSNLIRVGIADAADQRLVVTIDDLPYVQVTGGAYVRDGRKATAAIIGALQKHRVPAVGFVNEARLNIAGEMDARVALLQQWVDAGMLLGNHTYSHREFNGASIEEFQDEIIRGDTITRRLIRAHEPYQLYFRHPMTRTGDTREKKEAIEIFLQTRSYKIAPHTIENMDFAFNVVYVAAKERGDLKEVKRIATTYLDFTFASTAFAENMAPKVFGNDIPQTLLIHANDVNADLLDEMLATFVQRGYRFISLDEAMAHPAYQTRDTVVSPAGPTWLWRWSRSLGKDISFREEPEAPEWIMKAYRAGTNY